MSLEFYPFQQYSGARIPSGIMTSDPDGAEELPISSYDLIPKLIPNLDAHLIFPLLEFAAGLAAQDGDDDQVELVQKATYELLKDSNMTDYVAGLYCHIHRLDKPPVEFAKQREKVLAKMTQFDNETAKITDLLQNEEVISNLRSDKVANLEFLKKEHSVSSTPLDFHLARNGEMCG